MNRNLNIVFDKELISDGSHQIYWNLYFKSHDNVLSIPYEINKNSDYYKELYLSFIDKLNSFFTPRITLDNFPYWLVTGISSKQSSFTSPFEIENTIKFFFLENYLLQNNFSKISIIGALDVRIYNVIKSMRFKSGVNINYNIKLLNKVRIRKYLSIVKLFLQLIFHSFLNLFGKSYNFKNYKQLIITYSSFERSINYWGGLTRLFNTKNTLSILIDINSTMRKYKQKTKFTYLFLYNYFDLGFLIKKYLRILVYYKQVINANEFLYKNNVNLKYLFKDIIFKDFVGHNAFFNSLVISASNKLSKNLDIDIKLLYPRENQSWEKILLFYLNKRSKSIGYLHAGFKFWDLRYYLNDYSLLKSNNMIPNHFAIHSQRLIDILLKSKFFNKENFSLVESLRLKNFSVIQKTTSPKSLIVLLDYDINSSIKQIKLVKSFMDKYSFSKVKFKPHPANSRTIRQLFKDIILVDTIIIDIVKKYSHFFCSNNTTLSLELINCGFNTAIMSSEENLDMNPLKIYDVKTKIIYDEDDLNSFLKTNGNIYKNNLIHFDNELSSWRNLLN